MEIERKWVLSKLPDLLPIAGTAKVYQGYISREPEVRLRRNTATAGVCRRENTLTIKKGSGLSREEYEIRLDKEQFEALLPAVTGHDELTKEPFTIYQLNHNLLLEVSVIRRGDVQLVIGEVEFPDEATANAFHPTQFKQYIIKEVTGDKRWGMGSLSKNPDWSDLQKELDEVLK